MVVEVAPGAWTPPHPSELPQLRESLVDSLGQPFQRRMHAQVLGTGRGAFSPKTGDVLRDAEILFDEEQQRLTDAVLYYVSTDMTRMARAAAETLPLHNIHREDVPAEAGFMVFAEPIGAYLPPEDPIGGLDPVTIVACTWGPSAVVAAGTGVWVTLWAVTDMEGTTRAAAQHYGLPLSRAREKVRGLHAELSWDNEVVLHYGASMIGLNSQNVVQHSEPIDTSRPWQQIRGTTLEWAHIVRAAWLLMTQPGITDVTEEHLRKTQRRQMQRRGYAPVPVRLVRIRDRENTPQRAESGGREYQVRWTVRGHWRNQWYPSREEHRPVWINPHIKGPAGAPLSRTQTVHVLDNEDPGGKQGSRHDLR